MHDWRDLLIRQLTSFAGLGVALTASLLLFGWFVLSRQERKELRLPTGLLLVCVAFELISRTFGATGIQGRTPQLLVQLILLVALARVGFIILVDWFVGKQLNKPIPRIFRDILQALLFIGIALVLFRSMGVELGSLLTTSAILTAVIGLSLQESLGNLVAGLAVRAEHPFELGDWVEVGEGQRCLGRVIEINWRATKLRTNDAIDIVVPNGFIAKTTISNYSRPSRATRRSVTFQGPYDVPPDRVREAVLAALRGCPGVSTTPAPRLWVAGFGDSGVNYTIVYFLDDFGARSDIESDIRTRVWYGLSRARITIPFPVRDVRMHDLPFVPVKTPTELDTQTRLRLMSGIALFSAIPEHICEQMAEVAHAELYAEGERIIVEGEAGNDLFVVASGQVTVVNEHSTTGERRVLATLDEGHMFGELSLITGVRGATVLAATQTVLLRIGHDEFRRVVSQVAGLGEALLTQVVERQVQLDRPENLGLDPATPSMALRGALFEKIRRFFSA